MGFNSGFKGLTSVLMEIIGQVGGASNGFGYSDARKNNSFPCRETNCKLSVFYPVPKLLYSAIPSSLVTCTDLYWILQNCVTLWSTFFLPLFCGNCGASQRPIIFCFFLFAITHAHTHTHTHYPLSYCGRLPALSSAVCALLLLKLQRTL